MESLHTTATIDLSALDADVVVVDPCDQPSLPIPAGSILRLNPGPVYVMGDDGRWHRHSSVRS